MVLSTANLNSWALALPRSLYAGGEEDYLKIRITLGTRRCPLEGAILVLILFVEGIDEE